MDFFKLVEKSTKNGIDVYPDFKVARSEDLMIRAKSFYAIWDQEKGLWSTDEYDVQRLIDSKLSEKRKFLGPVADVRWMGDFSTNSWKQFRSYMANVSDNSVQLDEKLTFSNTDVKKTDYVSRRLPYPLKEGDTRAYEEIISTLYDPADRAKIEWSIGAIVAGEAKDIQKFLVLYGPAGAGKSTILNIIQKLFQGYYVTFEAKALTSNSNAFSTEVFRSNPLVAIQHDGDLSKIEDNTKLNSIVSHEEIIINEKYKPGYMARVNAFLFMATNKPVKITDAKSGIIRRLIDAQPSGRMIPEAKYHILMSQIDFELGAIAYKCLETYRRMGKDYYSAYRPVEMMLQTDVFYNFIEAYYDTFKEQDGTTLIQAYEMYKQYCDETNVEFKLPRYKFREELRNYFKEFHERIMIDNNRVRSAYLGFLKEKFNTRTMEESHAYALSLEHHNSLLDDVLAECPAQYSKWSEKTNSEIPGIRWADVETTLSELNTTKVHYVKPPQNHIVIDFDLKDEYGEKSAERNIGAASKWPSTYAEYSQGGAGIHLHYIYDGDPLELSRIYSDGIEIKVFSGDSSLRRRLSKCNNVPVARISSGLPLKEKKVINFDTVQSEKGIRDLIFRNLRKEIHPGTKPSVDFIHKILEDAYSSGVKYDLTDMRPKILAFAANSTHQSEYCVKLISDMKFKSDEPSEVSKDEENYIKDSLVFFDIEVYLNLLYVGWKIAGPHATPVRMFNPKPKDLEPLLNMKLVGYNCRRYDNHILYARYIGYSIEDIYKLSTKLINNSMNGTFAEAYDISYADIYDFLSEKKSLKRWQLELGIAHMEMGIPWDQPVPEELWESVAEYCENDIISEEVVFNARHQDFVAREILASLSGLKVNATTQQHTARIIFGSEPKPQSSFVYTDLSTLFPGYKFELGKSFYRGENPGEGGYVYAEPGMYSNVAVLDIASMHPTSIEQLNLFGPYTKNFSELKSARIAIKHKDFESAKKMLNGILTPYLEEEDNFNANDLAYALKIVINTVYGLTSAKFDNKFRDIRNIDNIVAKRGALFMIDLKHAVQEKGYQVIHIKTDSIKIPNATKEIIDFITDFGLKYGYDFEHETTYEKMCLVNDAVFISKDETGWHATGAQFQHPYVFKSLFTKEPIEFKDLCEIKAVTTALYLDFDAYTPMFKMTPDKKPRFIGKAGSFVPIVQGKGGGLLLREKDGKYYAATGTKGYFWMESEMAKSIGAEKDIDMRYYRTLVDDAIEAIKKYGDAEWFIGDLGEFYDNS